MDPIEVRVHGDDGATVVVLHGGPGAPGSMWRLAEDLSDEFHVLEPLQRQRAEVRLTVETHVRDLFAVAPANAHIVGHSWGAMLALSFASQHPAATRSVTLLGCGTYDVASRNEYRRALQQRLGPDGRCEYEELEGRLRTADNEAERDLLRRARAALSLRAQSVDLLASEQEWRGDAVGAEQTWADVVRLQAEGVVPQRFAAITAPVLMLHGDSDPHPGRMIARTLRAHVPQLEYVELERCGHIPWEERHARDECLRQLRTFLRAPRR